MKKIRGIESGSKYKSTVLTKSKDQKNEFTAKKMKMEIENIINKRNKQLYYRVESAQLTWYLIFIYYYTISHINKKIY